MRWRSLSLAFAVAAIPAAGLGWYAAQPGNAPPRGVVDDPVRVVRVPKGQDEVRLEYRITNVGDRPLELGKVSTTCGCTEASINARIIRGGESAVVRVVGDPPTVGNQTVQIEVPSNAVGRAPIVMQFTMAIDMPIPFVYDRPEVVQFAVVGTKAEAATFRIDAQEYDREPPWIAGATSTLPGLGVTGRQYGSRSVGDGVVVRSYTFRCEWEAPPAPGDHVGSIRILTGKPAEAAVAEIPVFARAQREVYASPAALYARLVPGATAPRLRLSLRCLDADHRLEVHAGPGVPDGLRIERIDRYDHASSIELAIVGEGPADRDGTLVFLTNHPAVPTVEVPYKIVRAGRP